MPPIGWIQFKSNQQGWPSDSFRRDQPGTQIKLEKGVKGKGQQ